VEANEQQELLDKKNTEIGSLLNAKKGMSLREKMKQMKERN